MSESHAETATESPVESTIEPAAESTIEPAAESPAEPAAAEAASSATPVVSEATRHVMQANRSKNTSPELLVRRKLRAAGLPGYRLHWKQAAGRPDVCYPGRKVAIFVNGCYWHRCPYCALPLPKTNVEFWQHKFERNMARDERTHRTLLEQRWCVLDVWECQLKGARLERTMEALVSEVGRASARETGRLRLPGATAPWKLAVRRRRLHR